MRELFVWYRVAADRAVAARAAVQAMQRSLCAEVSGLDARLLVRDADASSMQTWMESYARANAPAGVGVDIEAGIEARARPLAAFINGPRHVEAFDFVARD